MEKNQLLTLIQEQIEQGSITAEEIQQHISPKKEHTSQTIFTKNITTIFYVIGAVIVLIGAIILIGQNWEEIEFIGRLIVTFGIALSVYIPALYMRGNEHRILSQIFFTISCVLMPLGVFVILREYALDFDSALQTLTAFGLFVIFLSAFIYTKRNILVLFNLAFATWGYYALIAWLFDIGGDIAKWATMLMGCVYLLIAYYYEKQKECVDSSEKKEKAFVRNIIYGLGTIGILAPTLSFGGIFDLLSIALIFCTFYVSTFVKSKAMLFVSALFLVIYIFKITSEYFADSISWPLALIGIGFLVIGVGYGTLYINKKYITKEIN